ncbi:MAG: hypothetical protein K8F54_11970 [Altibacter sp.]|uniref:hypothetical protein n=1 Tax=Altibacter sp. TaxID=2024823 RepID=UPI001E1636CE|nr:hypothetical protein [Altibacter sp.]MBZ0328317.1 hypothetical protein [Altibacter sp.]
MDIDNQAILVFFVCYWVILLIFWYVAKKRRRVLLINLTIHCIYGLFLLYKYNKAADMWEDMDYWIFLLLAIALHAIVNVGGIILNLIRNYKNRRVKNH